MNYISVECAGQRPGSVVLLGRVLINFVHGLRQIFQAVDLL